MKTHITRRILTWEILGCLFILVLGTLLHFAFEWSGFWNPSAVFCPVNESVWEHLKMGFWPVILLAIIQFGQLRKAGPNFILAKTCSLYLIPLIILVLFYTYTGIIGYNILWADILTFVIATIIGQYVSYRILLSRRSSPFLNCLAVLAIIAAIYAFAFFTYHPAKIPLFKDSSTGKYGILYK